MSDRSAKLTTTKTHSYLKFKIVCKWGADLVLVIVAMGQSFVLFLFLRESNTPEPHIPPKTPTVGIIGIKELPLELTTELPGRVVATEVSKVRPQVSGVIRHRTFEEGAHVKKGQLLYVIEDAPYREAVVSAKGKLAEATAMTRLTRSRAERYTTLLSHNAISRQEAVDAWDAYQLAQAKVRAHRSALNAALVTLEFTRIRAPISGQIGPSSVAAGAFIQSGQQEALAFINRTDEVFVDLIQPGDKPLNMGKSFDAKDFYLRESINTAQVRLILPDGREYGQAGIVSFSEANVHPVSGPVTWRALFQNPDAKLLPGMTVRARLNKGIKTRGILVPQRGITFDVRGNGVALIVGKDNIVVRKSVVIDRAIENHWLITAGLAENDRLIVDGLNSLNPGQLVRPFASRQPFVAASYKHER